MRAQRSLRVLGEITDVGASGQTTGDRTYYVGSKNMRLTFDWTADRSGGGQAWCLFYVRYSPANGVNYNYQKADNSNAIDYNLVNTTSGQTGIIGIGYTGVGTFVVEIIGSALVIKKNGTTISSATRADSQVEAGDGRYARVNPGGGTIANLLIQAL